MIPSDLPRISTTLLLTTETVNRMVAQAVGIVPPFKSGWGLSYWSKNKSEVRLIAKLEKKK